MFTGIVQAVGRIEKLQAARRSPPAACRSADVRIGDSICVQGCCLTW